MNSSTTETTRRRKISLIACPFPLPLAIGIITVTACCSKSTRENEPLCGSRSRESKIKPAPQVADKSRRFRSEDGFAEPAPPAQGMNSETLGYERFADFKENEFLDAAKNPLSTFSIDVDTASYANVRRYLEQYNRLPPRASVRLTADGSAMPADVSRRMAPDSTTWVETSVPWPAIPSSRTHGCHISGSASSSDSLDCTPPETDVAYGNCGRVYSPQAPSIRGLPMRYEHPALIPQSDRYSELRWIGDRIPCATYNHRGDTHPQTWALHQNFTTKKGCELTVLESNRPWGPFNLVHCEWMWYNSEAGHYRPRVPLKWFDQEKLVGYLPCSANWEGQAEYYRPQLRKFKLIPRTRF